MIIDRLIKLTATLLLFSPMPMLGQEEGDGIIHIHCVLDKAAFEGSASFNEMLFHLDTMNLTWASSNLIDTENGGEDGTASEEDIEEWEKKKKFKAKAICKVLQEKLIYWIKKGEGATLKK